MLRTTLALLTLFSIKGAFAREPATNVVPKAIFGGSVYRAFHSPALPPVGNRKTTFAVAEPVTGRSPVYVSPVPRAEAPQGKPDTRAAAATSNKSNEQGPVKK
jgi:hypothetical protein